MELKNITDEIARKVKELDCHITYCKTKTLITGTLPALASCRWFLTTHNIVMSSPEEDYNCWTARIFDVPTDRGFSLI